LTRRKEFDIKRFMILKKTIIQILTLPLSVSILFTAKLGNADALADWYGHFGACLLSPSSSRYQKMWSSYETEIRKKIALNIPELTEMPVPKEIQEYLQNLSRIAPLVGAFNEIKASAWARELYSISDYNEVLSSQAFIYALEDPNFMQTTKDPVLQNEYDSDSQFRDAFDQILSSLKDPGVQQAISYFQGLGLSFMDPEGMQSALQLISFYKLPNQFDTIKFTDLFKDLPKPTEPASSDIFGKALWTLETNAVVDFLENHPIQTGRTVSEQTAETLNALTSPEGTSPYDDYLVKYHQQKEADTTIDYYLIGKKYTLTEKQISAIDGVSRTLWGEVAECANAGMHQFEVVGLAITNRALAISSALNEETKIQQDNDKINMNDVDAALHISDKSYTQKYEQSTSQGLKVFGIPYSDKLPAEQVVSRPKQFSIWNSFGSSTHTIASFGVRVPVGIPAAIPITFKIPVNDSPLINTLCPQISANETSDPGWNHSWPATYDQNWKDAVDLATMIVLDPKLYKKTYETNPKPRAPVMSYTDDGIPLEGLHRQPLASVTFVDPYSDKVSHLSVFHEPGVASCNTLKIFSYPLDANFGVEP
jgi:hypothetical protein